MKFLIQKRRIVRENNSSFIFLIYVKKKKREKIFLPRSHWNKWHGKIKKAKVSYETKEDAEKFLKEHELKNYNVYKCPECGKYHIGHS